MPALILSQKPPHPHFHALAFCHLRSGVAEDGEIWGESERTLSWKQISLLILFSHLGTRCLCIHKHWHIITPQHWHNLRRYFDVRIHMIWIGAKHSHYNVKNQVPESFKQVRQACDAYGPFPYLRPVAGITNWSWHPSALNLDQSIEYDTPEDNHWVRLKYGVPLNMGCFVNSF